MNRDYEEIPMDQPFDYEGDFKLIPDGEYDFRVISLERKEVEAGEKSPQHRKVEFAMEIFDHGDRIGKVTDNIPMLGKFKWKYVAFGRSIGQVAPDQTKGILIDFRKVIGAEGRCKVSVRKFKKRDGSDGESNQVEYLLPAAEDASFPDTADSGNGGW